VPVEPVLAVLELSVPQLPAGFGTMVNVTVSLRTLAPLTSVTLAITVDVVVLVDVLAGTGLVPKVSATVFATWVWVTVAEADAPALASVAVTVQTPGVGVVGWWYVV
jgi:hypothetical protein